jgi:hypothetical protein
MVEYTAAAKGSPAVLMHARNEIIMATVEAYRIRRVHSSDLGINKVSTIGKSCCENVDTLFDSVSFVIGCSCFLVGNALLVVRTRCLVLGFLVLPPRIVKQERPMSVLLLKIALLGRKQDVASTF